MTENTAELTRKIAELEAQLQALRQAEAAPMATAPAGIADVSGTLRGNAVGVNYGTVQAFFGAQIPTDAKEGSGRMSNGTLSAILQGTSQ